MRPSRLIGSLVLATAALVAAACHGDPSAPAPAAVRVGPTGPQDIAFHSLIACPVGTALHDTLTLDENGGHFELGPVRVEMPAGAITGPTQFSIDIPASPYLQFDVSAVGIEHFRFAQTISVAVDYSRCDLSTIDGSLMVWYVDDAGNPLEKMPAVDDRANMRVTFFTPHLSGYAIAD